MICAAVPASLRLTLHSPRFPRAHEIDDQHFVFDGRILDIDVHQETVHLRLGQRVGTFLLNRVLRCHDHEQRRHLVRCACHRHLPLFHGFKHGRLHFGGRPIDLVTKHDVGEDRPGLETKLALAVLLVVHLGAGDVRGQQIRRELDATEVGLEIFASALIARVFASPGKPSTSRLPFASNPMIKRSTTSPGR